MNEGFKSLSDSWPFLRELNKAMNEDALLEFSLWQREETIRLRRLRKIERWRYKEWLKSFDNQEPGEAPYGVYQGP